MKGLNLHGLVRGAVAAAHPDETATLYRSTGQKNVKGRIRAVYAEGESIGIQIQSEKDEALYHADCTGRNAVIRKAWLFSADSSATRPAGIVRPLARTGDMLQRADGAWWLVVAPLEDFSSVGWVCVRIVLQVRPPDLEDSGDEEQTTS